jgi:toxin secretion/phage lysis holin
MRHSDRLARGGIFMEVSHAIHRFDRPPKHRGTLRRNHRKCADNQGITPGRMGLKHKGSEAVQELAASVAAIGKKWAQLKKRKRRAKQMGGDTVKVKGILGIFGTVIGYLYNALTELVVVLVFLMIMDYILGIAASFIQNRRFDKSKAIKGIVKKLLYPAIVALAFLGDYTILYLTQSMGISLPVQGMIGIAALAYLIGTEGFSCAQNCVEIGLPVPDFLSKFFGFIKDQSGKLVRVDEVSKSG